MSVYLTSDPHWGHEFVAKTRGFDSADEHDEALMNSYEENFRSGDTIWWLGDLAVNGHGAAVVASLTTKPEAQHHLIFGNHDPGHPMHRHAYRHQASYIRLGFDSTQAFARRRATIKGQRTSILLSHFPYAGEGERDIPDRYTQYRLRDEGQPLIHGHTHSTEKVTRTERGTLQIHVGWDAWRRPVRLEEVLDLIERHY